MPRDSLRNKRLVLPHNIPCPKNLARAIACGQAFSFQMASSSTFEAITIKHYALGLSMMLTKTLFDSFLCTLISVIDKDPHLSSKVLACFAQISVESSEHTTIHQTGNGANERRFKICVENRFLEPELQILTSLPKTFLAALPGLACSLGDKHGLLNFKFHCSFNKLT